MDDVTLKQPEDLVNDLKVMPGWFWPKYIYSNSTNSFEGGVFADHNKCSFPLFQYRLLPFAEHLIPKFAPTPEEREKIKARDEMIERTAMTTIARWPLFSDVELITPTLFMILTGKPSIERPQFYKTMQKDLINTYRAQKQVYEEALKAFKELRARAEAGDEEAREQYETCKDSFESEPEPFFQRKEAQQIARQYLVVARSSYLTESMSLKEYECLSHPPTQPARVTAIYYQRVCDMLAIYQGFMDPVNDKARADEFNRVCREADRTFAGESDALLISLMRKYPRLTMAVDQIITYYDRGYSVPNWNDEIIHACLSEGDMVQAMHEYTVGMIAALERRILTMIGMDERVIPYFLITHLDTSLKLNKGYMPVIKKANEHLFSVRYNFLGNVWSAIAPLHTAVLQEENPKVAMQEQRSVLLALANEEWSNAAKRSHYKQLSDIVTRSVDPKMLQMTPLKLYLDAEGHELRVFNH